MINIKEIKQQVKEAIYRLKGWAFTVKEEKATSILEKLTDDIEAIKTLGLMEASDNWEEFQKLDKKRKNRFKKAKEKEPEGFDKILTGIMKVPKPKDEDKK